MTTGNVVSVDQIQAALQAVLDHVRANYGDAVQLESDYFWSIPDGAKFDIYTKPAELTVGQISEAYDHVAKISGDNAATFQLRWFAQLFEAIAHDKAV